MARGMELTRDPSKRFKVQRAHNSIGPRSTRGRSPGAHADANLGKDIAHVVRASHISDYLRKTFSPVRKSKSKSPEAEIEGQVKQNTAMNIGMAKSLGKQHQESLSRQDANSGSKDSGGGFSKPQPALTLTRTRKR